MPSTSVGRPFARGRRTAVRSPSQALGQAPPSGPTPPSEPVTSAAPADIGDHSGGSSAPPPPSSPWHRRPADPPLGGWGCVRRRNGTSGGHRRHFPTPASGSMLASADPLLFGFRRQN